MSDEFDDEYQSGLQRGGLTVPDKTGERHRSRVARLASRLYLVSSPPMRARMLDCLLRPLGSLGLVAVASGAFASLLHRGSDRSAGVPLDDLGRYSKDQIVELVRFVEQVSPEALQQLDNLVVDSPMGAAAVGASVAMLLLKAMRGRGAVRRETGDEGTSRTQATGQ